MYTAELNYDGELRTTLKHNKSGSKITTDAPTDNHGKGEAFSPTDLLSVSLASCMITVMGIYADKNELRFERAHASVIKTMTTNPRRVSKIEIQIKLEDIYSASEKDRLEAIAKGCPVAKSLHQEILQAVQFTYVKRI